MLIRNLTVGFPTPKGLLKAVDDVNLSITQGEVLALVGESGCGKSTLAFALMDMVPEPGFIVSGEVILNGQNFLEFSSETKRQMRGKDIAMVFQASMNSFNPVLQFYKQVEHIFAAHPEVWPNHAEGIRYFRNLLKLVRLDPDFVLSAYPHELSGGMKQRMAIAVSLLMKPKLLLLDEPTTALDVLNQRLVLDILRQLHKELNVTVVFVTHDLGVVADIADRVGVMYAGRLVDFGTIDQVFYDERRHPYVSALLRAAPSPFGSEVRPSSIPGTVPDLLELPPGCRFASRCPLVREVCHGSEPSLEVGGDGHMVSCHVMSTAISSI